MGFATVWAKNVVRSFFAKHAWFTVVLDEIVGRHVIWCQRKVVGLLRMSWVFFCVDTRKK